MTQKHTPKSWDCGTSMNMVRLECPRCSTYRRSPQAQSGQGREEETDVAYYHAFVETGEGL